MAPVRGRAQMSGAEWELWAGRGAIGLAWRTSCAGPWRCQPGTLEVSTKFPDLVVRHRELGLQLLSLGAERGLLLFI